MDLIETADAEQAVIDELTPYFSTSTSLPTGTAAWPAVVLRVLAAGGTQRDMVTDAPLLTLEAFAATETAAGAGLKRAVALLQYAALRKGSIGAETCYGLRLASLPQNFPLPSVPTRKRYIVTIAPDLRRRSVTI